MSTTTTRHRVATNIELARRVRGISKRELAAAVPMSSSTFYTKMNGRVAFDSDDLDRIGEILAVDPGEFFSPDLMPVLVA